MVLQGLFLNNFPLFVRWRLSQQHPDQGLLEAKSCCLESLDTVTSWIIEQHAAPVSELATCVGEQCRNRSFFLSERGGEPEMIGVPVMGLPGQHTQKLPAFEGCPLFNLRGSQETNQAADETRSQCGQVVWLVPGETRWINLLGPAAVLIPIILIRAGNIYSG